MEFIDNGLPSSSRRMEFTLRISEDELNENELDMVKLGISTSRPWIVLQAFASASVRNDQNKVRSQV